MPTVSTHVIDGALGGGRQGIQVDLHDVSGSIVASVLTDPDGRASFAGTFPVGIYTVIWKLGGSLLSAVSALFELSSDSHYHLPVVASAASATVYRGV